MKAEPCPHYSPILHIGMIRFAMRLNGQLTFWTLSQASFDMLPGSGPPLAKFNAHRPFVEALASRMAENFERMPVESVLIEPSHVIALGIDPTA